MAFKMSQEFSTDSLDITDNWYSDSDNHDSAFKLI